MGAVFRPKDLPSGRKKIIENAVRDFSPDVKDFVVKTLDSRLHALKTSISRKCRNFDLLYMLLLLRI